MGKEATEIGSTYTKDIRLDVIEFGKLLGWTFDKIISEISGRVGIGRSEAIELYNKME